MVLRIVCWIVGTSVGFFERVNSMCKGGMRMQMATIIAEYDVRAVWIVLSKIFIELCFILIRYNRIAMLEVNQDVELKIAKRLC